MGEYTDRNVERESEKPPASASPSSQSLAAEQGRPAVT